MSCYWCHRKAPDPPYDGRPRWCGACPFGYAVRSPMRSGCADCAKYSGDSPNGRCDSCWYAWPWRITQPST